MRNFLARSAERFRAFASGISHKQTIGAGAFVAAGLIAGTPLAEHKQVQLNNARFVSPEETLLINALHNWEDGNPALATTALDSLLLLAPKFGVAQSLRQAIRKTPKPGDAGIYETVMAQPVSNATKTEFQQRWDYFLSPAPAGKVPASLLPMADSQKYAITVDMSRNRIYLFENKDNQPQLIADFYAGIGSEGVGKEVQGDKKTPIGVYFVTSQLADEDLDELYGIGAFPINYPNDLDKERERTGNGIWIHGVPRNTWTRAPQSSRGCVTIANRDFERLMGRVKPRRTPVVLSEGLNWVDSDTQIEDHNALLLALKHWADDWQSLKTARYLSHYSEDFSGQGMNFAQWKEHKYRVNERKEWIKVSIDDVSLFRDPREDIVVATFLQTYESNNFSSRDYKRQFWQRQENGEWKILLENGT